VHQFLEGGAPRPTTLSPSWQYRGTVYQVARHDYQATSRVTLGARAAFDHYAAIWGVRPMTIARGLMTDLLEGRVRKLRIVAFSELWGDPDRYLHPEKFVK
jgi:hypothetical protein